MATTLSDIRRHAIRRTLFAPTTLKRAIRRLGFLQADPIRAPARAQDLTLRHRVKDYRAGDLERRYGTLGIEEGFFVNYGFMPADVHALMHPRRPRHPWSNARLRQAHALLDFVRHHGVVHPREVDAHFAHGKVRNWFGGSSNSTTQLLDAMHFRGMLRVARRDSGIRLYAARVPAPASPRQTIEQNAQAHDRLIDIVVAKYAPLPAASLGQLVSLLSGGVPQWRGQRAAALLRAKQRLTLIKVDAIDWYLPTGERLPRGRMRDDDRVHLLAPFDPLVWDRRRFELFWGWSYRFEAYTPAARRKRGYYALPLLWREGVVGWANITAANGRIKTSIGYVSGSAPRDSGFARELEAELDRMQGFLQQRQ